MKYRKKPVEIEAMKLTRGFADVVFNWIGRGNIAECSEGEFKEDSCFCEIKTLEGEILASEGDYIIRGVRGEFYPCKPDIFEMTYEPVESYQFKADGKTLDIKE